MRKKHTQNLTNISINKGAVSILVRALKNRQFSPGTQGVKVKVTEDLENCKKVKMYNFSATFHTTVIKLGQLVVSDKTFQNM